ncbi:MAG: FHA domain-containing protein [Pseudomonadota bacterium]
MAFVKICPLCGHHTAPDAAVCADDTCNYSLVGVIPEPFEESGGVGTGGAPSAAGGKILELIFPFGPRTITENTVLGRINADFGAQIAASENGRHVSGEHAAILVRDGNFFVQHMGRSDRNRTYVDREELADGQEVQLREGQTLSLSKFYHVQVRFR